MAIASTAAAQAEPERRVAAAPLTSATVGAEYRYAWFHGDIDSWHLGAFSAAMHKPAGAIIVRLNVARRFAAGGYQVEADAYPTLGRNTYAYLNVGRSRSSIFPGWRLGGEVFQTLPRSIDASIGFRYLGFLGAPVNLVTGSFGRRGASYGLSLRPFLRILEKGLSASAGLTGRRYFEDPDTYVGARFGYGAAPDDEADLSQLSRTGSASAGLHGSRAISPRTILTWLFSYERERRRVGPALDRWVVGTGVKLRY
jgi:YaiO family outer membrane protein